MANAAYDMAVHDDCKLKFLEFKAKRTYRFIVFKIEEKHKQVVVEKLKNYQKSRIFFIAWSPDTSRVKSKMIYASSKDRFKTQLDGIQVKLQGTDPIEMGLDVIRYHAN